MLQPAKQTVSAFIKLRENESRPTWGVPVDRPAAAGPTRGGGGDEAFIGSRKRKDGAVDWSERDGVELEQEGGQGRAGQGTRPKEPTTEVDGCGTVLAIKVIKGGGGGGVADGGRRRQQEGIISEQKRSGLMGNASLVRLES